jgi:hypothetical protein
MLHGKLKVSWLNRDREIIMKKQMRKVQNVQAGQYIRAVVNLCGVYWLEYRIVHGRPYKRVKTVDRLPRPFDFARYSGFVVTVLDNDRTKSKFFVDDLVGHDKTHLFKFSNTQWDRLSAAKDVFHFLELRDGKSLSEAERNDLKLSWHLNREYSSELQQNYDYT